MSVPNLEDHVLAGRIDRECLTGSFDVCYLETGKVAQLIADHCAPLRESVNELYRLQAIIDDAKDMTGTGPDVMISRTLLKTLAGKVTQANSLNARIEALLKKSGRTLRISHCTDPVGNAWSADLGDWPFCSSGTIPHAIERLVDHHEQLEREELQKRINEIDQSASL